MNPSAVESAQAYLTLNTGNGRRQIVDICNRAHAQDRTTVLGGPSVSASPESYPGFDYLHIGELGDATAELVRRLAHDPSRPDAQVALTTGERLPGCASACHARPV